MHTKMTAVEGRTAVTPNVAVINLDSVARIKSLHFMLTMLVEGPALDTLLNSGQGEGCESWRRLVLEYDPCSRVRAAGSLMVILSHLFTSVSCSCEAFDAKVSLHERRTSEAVDDDVKVCCVLKNMSDESLRDHLMLQSKRLTTYVMVRLEVMDVVQARGVGCLGSKRATPHPVNSILYRAHAAHAIFSRVWLKTESQTRCEANSCFP